MTYIFWHYYDGNDIFFFLFIIGMVSIAVWLLYSALNSEKEDRQRETEFFDSLNKWFLNSLIKTNIDVLHIFEWLFKNSNQGITYYLKKFLWKLIRSQEWDLSDKVLMKEKVSSFIETFEKQHPFSGLPAYERNLLEDLDIFVKESNRDWISKKINELKVLILTRNDDYKRLERINKWSVPLSIIGILLSIIFFLIPYFYSPLGAPDMQDSPNEYYSND